MLYIPDKTLIQLYQMLFKFIWNAKQAKIKKSTIIALINEGGLGMEDITNTHQAATIGWIRWLTAKNNDKWMGIMLIRMGIKLSQLNKPSLNSLVKYL